MDRRTFVTLVAGTCLLEPFAVRAQQAGKIFRIGLLVPAPEPTPTIRIELVVNMKTAKALGLTIPQSLLLRADEVIQ